jgi:methionine aminopeptidase
MTNPSDFHQQLAAGANPDKELLSFQSGRIAAPANGVVLEFIAPMACKLRALRVRALNFGTAAGPSVFTATLNGSGFTQAVALSIANTATDDTTQTLSGGDQAIAEGDRVTITLSAAATGLANAVVAVDVEEA